MADAAVAFLDSLDDAQRAVARWPFDDHAERTRFFYTPTDHGGLRFLDMRPRQQQLAHRLVASGLSRAGYVTVSTVMGLENALDADEGWVTGVGRERGRDPMHYFVRVFGDPQGGEPWGWRFGGHHLSVNHVVVDGEVVGSTPIFLGADPASAPLLGPHPLRPLAGAEDLGRELVRSGYDAKALARILLNSHAYQRAVDPALAETSPLFTAPAPRRIGAEQLVDSLFAATGKPFVLEPINLDVDSVRTIDNALDLGRATRAWMLASTSNERDRPSLMLPRIQAVAEVLEVFGWRGARPDATSGIREIEANVLQPALLANGTMMTWLTRLSDDHGLTAVALEAATPESLVDRVFHRFFTRPPTSAEQQLYVETLRPGFSARMLTREVTPPPPAPRRKFVAWSNHMRSEANSLRLAEESATRRGDAPTDRLDPDWRRRFEDVVWALLNAPEWTHIK